MRFGVGHLTDVLAGRETEKVHELRPRAPERVRHRRRATKLALVKPVARALLARDALRADDYGGLSLRPRRQGDPEGRARRSRSCCRRSARAPPRRGAAADYPHDPLFEALRARRRELAAEARRAALCHLPRFDPARDGRAASPTSLHALSRVSGVGEAKLERYGAAFVEVIDAFAGAKEAAWISGNWTGRPWSRPDQLQAADMADAAGARRDPDRQQPARRRRARPADAAARSRPRPERPGSIIVHIPVAREFRPDEGRGAGRGAGRRDRPARSLSAASGTRSTYLWALARAATVRRRRSTATPAAPAIACAIMAWLQAARRASRRGSCAPRADRPRRPSAGPGRRRRAAPVHLGVEQDARHVLGVEPALGEARPRSVVNLAASTSAITRASRRRPPPRSRSACGRASRCGAGSGRSARSRHDACAHI